MRIALALPSGSSVDLRGQIQAIYSEGEFGGRGPGIDIALEPIPQSVMWLLESALASAGLAPNLDASQDQTPDDADIPAMPTLEEGDDWITAESDLVGALWQELTTMSKMNPFQLLGLPHTATDSEIRTVFGTLSKKYHPDRFARYESFEIHELANEVFMLLRDAYRDVSNAASRKKVLGKLNPGASRPPAVTKKIAPKVDDAPTVRPSGGAAVKTPPPAEAAPEAGDDRIAAGLKMLEQGEFKMALRIFSIEARKDGPCIEAKAAVEVAEGKIALENGNRMEAAERFETALDIDPSNERAAQEIAEMRRQATSQRRGLLTKLMKKG